MAQFDSLYKCSIGGTCFQLVDYKHHEEPVVRADGSLLAGRVGTKIVIEGKGYVEGASFEELNANLWSVTKAMAADGNDFRIFGIKSLAEVEILAACCIDRGPHISFDVLEQMSAGAMRKELTFKVEAQTARVDSGGSGNTNTPGGTEDRVDNALKVSVRPDGLRTVAYSGEVRGANVESRFLAHWLAPFRSDYSLGWVLSHEYSLNLAGDVLTYTMTATELRVQLPGGGMAFDGSGTMRRERDENGRLTTTWDFDLLLRGDPEEMAKYLRVYAGGGRIIRESFSVELFKETRLRFSITTVGSAENDGIVAWTQSFRTVPTQQTYELKEYPGVEPLLVKRPQTMAKLVQTGSAIGVGEEFPAVPDPLFDTLLEPPDLEHGVSSQELRVAWSYVMALLPDDEIPDPGMLWNRP